MSVRRARIECTERAFRFVRRALPFEETDERNLT